MDLPPLRPRDHGILYVNMVQHFGGAEGREAKWETGLSNMVPGKERVPSEEHEQIVFITRVRFLHPLLANNVMAIPNGGWRNKKQAALLKRAGVLRGAPDLLVALVRIVEGVKYPGLFIEMKKVKGGTVSADQRIVHRALRIAGYKVEVAYGADMAWDIFEEYVNGEE